MAKIKGILSQTSGKVEGLGVVYQSGGQTILRKDFKKRRHLIRTFRPSLMQMPFRMPSVERPVRSYEYLSLLYRYIHIVHHPHNH